MEWYCGIFGSLSLHLTFPCMHPKGGEGKIFAAGLISLHHIVFKHPLNAVSNLPANPNIEIEE